MADKKKIYRAHPRSLDRWPDMVTLVPLDLTQKIGPNSAVVSVALGSKEVRSTLPARANRPPVEVVTKPATQEQLKYLYEVEKNPHVQEIEE